MTMCLGDHVERTHRLARIVGAEPGSEGPWSVSLDGVSQVVEMYGRSHPFHGERDWPATGAFDGWVRYAASEQRRQPPREGTRVSWWLRPEPVSGIVVAATRCQFGWRIDGYQTRASSFVYDGEGDWVDPYFSQLGNFLAYYVAEKLGPITQLALIPAEQKEGPSMSPAEFRDVLRAQSEQATEREKL